MVDEASIPYWCEMAEAIAWREMIAAVQESGETTLGAEWAEVGGAVAFALRGMDNPFFNRVIGLGMPRPATRADVQEIDAFFTGLGREWAVVQVVEPTQPPELLEWLTAAGFTQGRLWPKLWRSLDGELPDARTDLRIERIGPDRRDDFGRIVLAAFDFAPELGPIATSTIGRAGWTHYVGFDGTDAVSAGATFVTADVAWLGFGATLESHRGRGGQTGMFARRLADARTAGCTLAITETGEDTPEEPNPSYRNMLRAGFELAYLRPNWVRRPAGQ